MLKKHKKIIIDYVLYEVVCIKNTSMLLIYSSSTRVATRGSMHTITLATSLARTPPSSMDTLIVRLLAMHSVLTEYAYIEYTS